MPWIYHQQSGKLYHDDKYIGQGWSGHGAGKYNPNLQNLQDVGPCRAAPIPSAIPSTIEGRRPAHMVPVHIRCD